MLNNKTENKQKVHNSINLHPFTKQAIIIKNHKKEYGYN